MRHRKINLGSRAAGLDENAVKRGYKLKQTTIHLLKSVVSSAPAKAGKATVRPGILVAAGAAVLFLLITIISGASDSPNEIRRRMPELRERYAGYLTTRLGPNSRAAIDRRWPAIESNLHEIAHYSQLEDWERMRLKIDELLTRERDTQSPVYQFCLELRKQTRLE